MDRTQFAHIEVILLTWQKGRHKAQPLQDELINLSAFANAPASIGSPRQISWMG